MLGTRGERIRWRWPQLGTLMAVAALCFAVVPAAFAANVEGGNSFSELSQKAQEEPATTATSTTAKRTTEESHNNRNTLFIGLGAAVVLLLAVAFVIVRDARRAAPAGPDDDLERERRKGRDIAARQANRRAKAKAARNQRKRNR